MSFSQIDLQAAVKVLNEFMASQVIHFVRRRGSGNEDVNSEKFI